MTSDLVTDHQAHHEDPNEAADEALEKLRELGIRITRSRRRIIETLAEQHEHLTADELADRLRAEGIHRATVYRTVESFSDVGVLSHHQLPGSASTYHLVSSTHFHGHCKNCGAVVAVHPKSVSALADQVARDSGFVLSLNDCVLVGFCSSCQHDLSGVPES